MKKTLSVLLLALSMNSFAQTYANPVNLTMKCKLASIIGNTNDSWSMTIMGLKAAFWDNNEWSLGRYESVVSDDGGGRYFKYAGPKGDAWSLLVGPTAYMTNNQVDPRFPHIYGVLKFPRGKGKDQILECHSISRAEAQEMFELATLE